MKDLQDIVHELKVKGVILRATEQPMDTGTAAGKACGLAHSVSPMISSLVSGLRRRSALRLLALQLHSLFNVSLPCYGLMGSPPE